MARKVKESKKGNPAHHRMGNVALKARRAASWARGRRRKDARIADAALRHAANVAAGHTRWEDVKAARAAARRNFPAA